MTIPVRTDLDSYRVALAELPDSAGASGEVEGAVTVVRGERFPTASRASTAIGITVPQGMDGARNLVPGVSPTHVPPA